MYILIFTYKCIYTYVHIQRLAYTHNSLFSQQGHPKRNDTSIEMSMLSISGFIIPFSSIISQHYLGEMPDFRTGRRNIQDVPGLFYSTRKLDSAIKQTNRNK